MAFNDRRKKAHLWRTANPYPTAEQVLTQVATGVIVDVGSKLVKKALAKFGKADEPFTSPPSPQTARKKAKKSAKKKSATIVKEK